MKKLLILIIFGLFAVTVLAQTPTVPSSVAVTCGDTAIITATGSTGTYVWFGDSLQNQLIGTGPTIYIVPFYDTTIYVGGTTLAAGSSITYNFTNCGISGRMGPTQTDVNTEYSGTNLDGDVTIVSQGIQQWIVPTTGYYEIEVAGAKGSLANGGPGAIVKGVVYLTAGDTLQILVGQKGLDVGSTYSSAGGGTFVAIGGSHTTAAPLIIAGGGGGVNTSYTLISNSYGSTSTSGSAGDSGGAGGTNGNGGAAATGSNAPGAGGGGFYTNGDSISGTRPVEGGAAFINGGNGGRGETSLGSFTGRPDGGFGGASGSANAAGGGGGCSGGGGGSGESGIDRASGGGGSYIDSTFMEISTSDGNYDGLATFNGTAIVDLAAYNTSDGYVNISLRNTSVTNLASVDITLLPIDDPIVSTPVHISVGDSVTLTASGSSGIYNWYADAAKTILVGTGPTFTTPVLTTNTSYYVEAVSGIPVRRFTNCGAIGYTGPDQADVNTAYAGTNLDGMVSVSTQGIQKWVVPYTDTYFIEASGAQGGHSNEHPYSGGLGALNRGEFSLTQGDTLYIIVGQNGESSNRIGGGGGGGGGASYIATTGNTPLLVAAGGGGADWNHNGYDAGSSLTTTSSAGSSVSGSNSGGNGAGFSHDAGGTEQYGGSSGGWVFWADAGGKSFISGGEGGSIEPTIPNDQNYPRQGMGGFGGGGAASNTVGGGGGGYAGGNGAPTSDSTAYGGVSFNDGSNQLNLGGANLGNGYVTIGSSIPYCESNLVEVEIITDVSIDDYSINNTQVYPNPVSDIVVIEIDNRESEHAQISVYDLIGKLIIEFPEEDLQQGANTFQYDMEFLSDGVYYLEIRIDMMRKLHKLIKE